MVFPGIITKQHVIVARKASQSTAVTNIIPTDSTSYSLASKVQKYSFHGLADLGKELDFLVMG